MRPQALVGMMSKSKIALIIGVIIVVILIALLAWGRISVLAEGTVIVILKDEETGKPIGRVDGGYARVILDDVDQGYVTDYGELRIEGVNPGTHELVVVVPYYGEVKRFVEVGWAKLFQQLSKLTCLTLFSKLELRLKLGGPSFHPMSWVTLKLRLPTLEMLTQGARAYWFLFTEKMT